MADWDCQFLLTESVIIHTVGRIYFPQQDVLPSFTGQYKRHAVLVGSPSANCLQSPTLANILRKPQNNFLAGHESDKTETAEVQRRKVVKKKAVQQRCLVCVGPAITLVESFLPHDG